MSEDTQEKYVTNSALHRLFRHVAITAVGSRCIEFHSYICCTVSKTLGSIADYCTIKPVLRHGFTTYTTCSSRTPGPRDGRGTCQRNSTTVFPLTTCRIQFCRQLRPISVLVVALLTSHWAFLQCQAAAALSRLSQATRDTFFPAPSHYNKLMDVFRFVRHVPGWFTNPFNGAAAFSCMRIPVDVRERHDIAGPNAPPAPPRVATYQTFCRNITDRVGGEWLQNMLTVRAHGVQ